MPPDTRDPIWPNDEEPWEPRSPEEWSGKDTLWRALDHERHRSNASLLFGAWRRLPSELRRQAWREREIATVLFRERSIWREVPGAFTVGVGLREVGGRRQLAAVVSLETVPVRFADELFEAYQVPRELGISSITPFEKTVPVVFEASAAPIQHGIVPADQFILTCPCEHTNAAERRRGCGTAPGGISRPRNADSNRERTGEVRSSAIECRACLRRRRTGRPRLCTQSRCYCDRDSTRYRDRRCARRTPRPMVNRLSMQGGQHGSSPACHAIQRHGGAAVRSDVETTSAGIRRQGVCISGRRVGGRSCPALHRGYRLHGRRLRCPAAQRPRRCATSSSRPRDAHALGVPRKPHVRDARHARRGAFGTSVVRDTSSRVLPTNR
jgi:hypothetical protein